MKVMFRGIAMLFVLNLSLLTGAAYSQELGSSTVGNHKFFYGIHLGVTGNEVDIYSTNGGLIAGQDGPLYTDGSHSYAYGFRLAVIGEARLGRCFSLRVMPGVSQFGNGLSKMESVRGEVPLDVKFHPIRKGNLEPYIASGLSYGYDFATQRDDGHNVIKPAHDLRYTCGLGVDWYTRIVRLGFELKAGFGLLPPKTSGITPNSLSYFHCGPSFTLGLNIEA